MDIQLPGMDRLELTRRLKADPLCRQTIVLAFTAYGMMGDQEKALAAGCDGYPIDTRTFPGEVAVSYSPLNTGIAQPRIVATGWCPRIKRQASVPSDALSTQY
jgi:response regulator RpfG family c-di-GMP phosphodiesterase